MHNRVQRCPLLTISVATVSIKGAMKKLVIAALLCPSVIQACLSLAGAPDPDAGRAERGKELLPDLRHAMNVNLKERRAYSRFGKGQTRHEIKQIEAIDLIYLGQYQTALAILLQVEKESPGGYDTAFNIGTVYELLGDDANALKWISEGIKRNPRSLAGSEWLHVAILEAKIEAANRPDHLLKGHIVEIPERLNNDSEIKVRGRSYWVPSVSVALYHQLHERLEFVKPTDPYVADLLYSYALLEGRLSPYERMLPLENALGLLKMAKAYGFTDDSLQSRSEPSYWAIRLWAVRLAVWGLPALLILLLPFWIAMKCHEPESWIYWAWQRFKEQRQAMIKS
jgi:tetratricopeptide (TPR) repeat protein